MQIKKFVRAPFILILILISAVISIALITKNNLINSSNIKKSDQALNNKPKVSIPSYTLPNGHKLMSQEVFSPDKEHSAFVVQTDPDLTKSYFYVVRDGIPSEQYGNIVAVLTFSPDSQKLAYVAGNKGGNEYFVIMNDQKSPIYDHIYFPTFSPDSKNFAYKAYRGDNNFVVLNGKEMKSYDYVPDSLIFSLDSKNIAYHAINKSTKKSFVVVNEKEIGPYDNVVNIEMTPDGSQLTFTALDTSKNPKPFKESISFK